MTSTTKRAWKLQEFVAHGSSVKCLSIGRKSGRVLATGGEDKMVNLWAVGNSSCIMSLTGHTTPVECVKFCRTEEMVCAGSMSGAIKIWDLESAEILRTLTGHKADVKCVDFHPYGDFITSGSMDTTIKLWDIRRKGCIYTYKGHSKCVNSLKFSPDGRWIASGSEDGSVKLWDLPAGKMLAEFCHHSGPVSDVDFHPNEFLLASGGSDRTVKFWDLESLQLVSATEGDSGAVRCIYFNPDGACLFTGADDMLKVYSWEPSRTYDTLMMGWSKLADLSVAQNQLIAGTFSLTNVSMYVIDLKQVQPFGKAPGIISSPQCVESSFQSRSHHRRSFFSDKRDVEQLHVMEMKPLEDDNSYILDGEPGEDIKEPEDYSAVFHPARESQDSAYQDSMSRTPPKARPFPAPPEDILKPVSSKLVSFSGTSNPSILTSHIKMDEKGACDSSTMLNVNMNATYTARSKGSLVGSGALIQPDPLESVTTAVPCSVGVVPGSLQSTSVPPRGISCTARTGSIVHPQIKSRPVRPIEKAKTLVRSSQILESTTVSIVRPVRLTNNVLQNKEVCPPQRTVILPEEKPVTNFIPTHMDTPAGLDLDEFLPHHLQTSHNPEVPVENEMSEVEALAIIMEQHKTLVTVLHHRLKHIKHVLAQWSTKEPKAALETALSMNDMALIADIFSVIALRQQIWNLDMCQTTLPAIHELLQSKYESHMSVGCACLRLILHNFGTLIKSNVTAPPGVGVDICREDRYNKCMSCYSQLLSIRAFLLKRQTMQGKLGQSFRELHILMQSLD